MPGAVPPQDANRVALIAARYQIDFSGVAEYMAIRGIGFLSWNTDSVVSNAFCSITSRHRR